MKSTILTRFELFCNGEAQRLGFLQGLDETGISEDLHSELVYKFNKELNLPPQHIFKQKVDSDKYIASYFTQEGLSKFKKEINNVVKAINEEDIFSVGKIVTNKDDNLVLYEDKYQVIQISQDLSNISAAVISDTTEDGQYAIIENLMKSDSYQIKELSLRKLDKYNTVKTDIIINPFYLAGELKYSIDNKRNIVTILNESIY